MMAVEQRSRGKLIDVFVHSFLYECMFMQCVQIFEFPSKVHQKSGCG